MIYIRKAQISSSLNQFKTWCNSSHFISNYSKAEKQKQVGLNKPVTADVLY